MKILWLEPEAHVPGGGPRTSLALAEALRTEGCDVELVSALPWNEIPERKDICDVVFSQQWSAENASLFARAIRKPMVHFLHGPGQVGTAPLSDLFVFNSWHQLDLARDDVSASGKTIVLHPRVADAVWHEQTVKRHAILTMGTGHTKGIDAVVGAAAFLPHEHFVIASNNAEPEGLPPNVIWTGTTPTPEKLYSIAKLFVLPSTVESFGLVYAEASVSGVPSIACDLPGPREALFDQGVFVPASSPAELASAISLSLARLPALERGIADARMWTADRERVELQMFLSALRALSRKYG